MCRNVNVTLCNFEVVPLTFQGCLVRALRIRQVNFSRRRIYTYGSSIDWRYFPSDQPCSRKDDHRINPMKTRRIARHEWRVEARAIWNDLSSDLWAYIVLFIPEIHSVIQLRLLSKSFIPIVNSGMHFRQQILFGKCPIRDMKVMVQSEFKFFGVFLKPLDSAHLTFCLFTNKGNTLEIGRGYQKIDHDYVSRDHCSIRVTRTLATLQHRNYIFLRVGGRNGVLVKTSTNENIYDLGSTCYLSIGTCLELTPESGLWYLVKYLPRRRIAAEYMTLMYQRGYCSSNTVQ
jgi:hypothetical protein